MKLPSFRRILEQDYKPDDQDLVKTLASSLNYGIEVLYDALNGKLTFRDNIASSIKEINAEVDSTGKPKSKITIKKDINDKIEGLFVIKVENLTNTNVYPSNGVIISYTETTDSILVNNIAGLKEGYIFKIKLVTIR